MGALLLATPQVTTQELMPIIQYTKKTSWTPGLIFHARDECVTLHNVKVLVAISDVETGMGRTMTYRFNLWNYQERNFQTPVKGIREMCKALNTHYRGLVRENGTVNGKLASQFKGTQKPPVEWMKRIKISYRSI